MIVHEYMREYLLGCMWKHSEVPRLTKKIVSMMQLNFIIVCTFQMGYRYMSIKRNLDKCIPAIGFLLETFMLRYTKYL